jgi:hypothetical protein
LALILGIEAIKKLDGVDLKTLAKYIEKQSTKTPETLQANQPCERESIDSPTTLGSSIKSRRKSYTMTSKNMEHRAKTSKVESTLGTQTSSTMTCFGTSIGNYDTMLGS